MHNGALYTRHTAVSLSAPAHPANWSALVTRCLRFPGVCATHFATSSPAATHRLLRCGAQGAGAAGMTTLISFDVDGTLIRSVGDRSNHLHKRAFSHCFASVYGVDTTIDVIQHHGGTDPLIIKKVLQHHGVDGDDVMQRMDDLQGAMCAYFEEHICQAGEGLEVLPGVVDLLEALQTRGDVVVCLVTGNLQPIGWAKMQAVGLRHLFSDPNFGGFGSDFCSGNTAEMWHDRAELIRIAAKKAAELHGGSFKAHYHVGDTPQDLHAAAGAGVYGVGVATGIYSREKLEDLNTGAVVLEGLADLGTALKAFGLDE